MAFMEPDIYEGEAYLVDGPMGIDVVPEDVCGRLVLTAYALGATLEALRDYIENKPEDVWSIERRKGWLGRLSAPGYMDCTPWTMYDTREEALADLTSDDDDEDGAADAG